MAKETLSTIAIILTLYAFFPYISSIIKGKTKPHVFSWVIWGITTLIVFFAQLADDAGIGAWPTGISAIITFVVAGLAYRKRASNLITRLDWIFLFLALSSLPLWYLTNNPLWAVVILTFVDMLGFIPTFLKSYVYPFDEQLQFFVIVIVRNGISIMALEHYSITTVLFPGAIACACFLFVLMVYYRRA